MGRRRSWTRHLIKRTDFEGITVKDGALRAARAPSPGQGLACSTNLSTRHPEADRRPGQPRHRRRDRQARPGRAATPL